MLTRYSSFMTNITVVNPYHNMICRLSQLIPLTTHIIHIIVTRVLPRTSKGITDLLSPHTSTYCTYIVLLEGFLWSAHMYAQRRKKKLRSRSLSESTRQNIPRTGNGHAPPPTRLRKNFQSVNPIYVLPW